MAEHVLSLAGLLRRWRLVCALACLALGSARCGREQPAESPRGRAGAAASTAPAPDSVSAYAPAMGSGPGWMAMHERFAARAAQGGVEALFLGDSLTHGWTGSGRAAWEEHLAPLKAEAFGIPGDRIEHLLWRVAHGELDGIWPKVVVVMIGTNNLKSGPVREPPEQVAAGIAALVDRIHQRLPRAVVLLLGILPRQPQYDWFAAAREQTNRRLAALAERNPRVRFLDFGDKMLDDARLPSRKLYGSDLLHLNASGYGVWAEAVAPVVRELAGQPSTRPARP